jgi:hypothetical protein
MKRLLFLLLITCTANSAFSQHVDTFEVYFPLNISKLSKESEAYLDRIHCCTAIN